MRQVIRLMDMPDKVIAFDELPQDLLAGLEMQDCSKLPRHWREFIGVREKVTRIPPDRDPLTGQVRTYTAISEKAPYAYLVDRELNSDRDKWSEIESYVRRNAPRDYRLMDKLVDMALPMAQDAHSELTLEPEDVKVIPLIKEELVASAPTVITTPAIPATPTAPPVPYSQSEPPQPFKITPAAPAKTDLECPACQKIFSSKQALRMHVTKKHSEPKVPA